MADTITNETVTEETTVEHSKNFNKIKGYYDDKLWNIDKVFNVVGKKAGITKEEYQEITGFEYPNKE